MSNWRDSTFPFEPGDFVDIVDEPGYLGKVLVADKSRDMYLIDPYPGAMGGYSWVKVGLDSYAANWCKSAQLRLIPENDLRAGKRLRLYGDAERFIKEGWNKHAQIFSKTCVDEGSNTRSRRRRPRTSKD